MQISHFVAIKFREMERQDGEKTSSDIYAVESANTRREKERLSAERTIRCSFFTFDLVTMFEANLTTAKFPLPIVFSSS